MAYIAGYAMTNLIFDDHQRLLPWANNILGERFDPARTRTIGQERNGRLNAVVVFDAITERNSCIHIATLGKHWLGRRFLPNVFDYAFNHLGLHRLTGLVPVNNLRALRFNHHLGFRYEGVIREAREDGDLVMLGMLRRECRFIPQPKGANHAQ